MALTTDDQHIVQSIRNGTEEGFKLLMKKYKEPIYWHIRRLVIIHDDAQDATQEAFIRIFRSFSQFKDDTSFRGWIFRIATNEALRMISSHRQEMVSLESGTTLDNKVLADNYVDYTDLEALKLQKAILNLPTKQQLAFNLRYYDELSYEEIAEATNSTTSAVKMNYHIAKEKIIKYMNSND